jgi:GT2 family glycosyltransferase
VSVTHGLVDIIIVNWNAGPALRRCLESIVTVNDARRIGQVIVIDNASTDGSADGLDVTALPLIVRRNPANVGFARACNMGARLGSSACLLFLNPDTELELDSLSVPLAFLEKPENSQIGIVGIQLLDEQKLIARSCARFPTPGSMAMRVFGVDTIVPRVGYPMTDWDHASSRRVDHVIGAFYMVRRSLFDSLGGFDERFFVYLEDLDFSLRAKQRGWSSAYLVEARAHHAGGGTSRQIKARRLFYALRSRIAFVNKHFGFAGAAALTLATLLVEPFPRLLRALLRGQPAEAGQTLVAFGLLWRDLVARTPQQGS